MAGGATFNLLMGQQALANGEVFAFDVRLNFADVRRRRVGRVVEQHFTNINAARDRLGAVAVRTIHGYAGLCQQSAAMRTGGQFHRAKMFAGDAGYLIKIGQPFVKHGPIGIEKIEHA